MNQRSYTIGLVMLIFFIFAYISNLLGPIIPDAINDFKISGTLAGLLPFSFFAAYGIMSIPAGYLLEKYNERIILTAAFFLIFIGAALFVLFPGYLVYVSSLFIIGSGIAALQVVINPLLRVAAGGENYAFFSVLSTVMYGIASYLIPGTYTYMVKSIQEKTDNKGFIIDFLSKHVPENLTWVSLYWLFAFIALVMMVVVYLSKYPKVELQEDEKVGAIETFILLFKNKYVWLYFIGIFAYVGSEQGIANWISQFLFEYHGMDPLTQGAQAISWYWALMAIGCLLGLILLKILDSRIVLIIFTGAAIVSLTFALFSGPQASLYAFSLMGFFLSVMWGIILSLALNSIKEHHGAFTSILLTAIVGGAFIPFIIGMLSDIFSLKVGMMFLYITLGYMFSIGFWANPLIKNKTLINSKE
jgi:fucose permease